MDQQHEIVVHKLSTLSMCINPNSKEEKSYFEKFSYQDYFTSAAEKLSSTSKHLIQNDSSYGIIRVSHPASTLLSSSPPFLSYNQKGTEKLDNCGSTSIKTSYIFESRFPSSQANSITSNHSVSLEFSNSRPQISEALLESPCSSSQDHFQSLKNQNRMNSHTSKNIYGNGLSALKSVSFSKIKHDSNTVSPWISNEKMSPCTPLSSDDNSSSAFNEASSDDFSTNSIAECTSDMDFECVSSLSFTNSFMGKGLSSHFKGKSRSFTCLSSVNDISNIQELAKPENPYNTKRKNAMSTLHSSSSKFSFFHPYSSPSRKNLNNRVKKSNHSQISFKTLHEEERNEDREEKEKTDERKSCVTSSYTGSDYIFHSVNENEEEKKEEGDLINKDFNLNQPWMNAWNSSHSFTNVSNPVSS